MAQEQAEGMVAMLKMVEAVKAGTITMPEDVRQSMARDVDVYRNQIIKMRDNSSLMWDTLAFIESRVSKLPEQHRKVLTQLYWDNRTEKEVCEQMSLGKKQMWRLRDVAVKLMDRLA